MDQHVSTDQLCIGIYIYIDLHWTKHPFLRQAFKIKDADELRTIRGLGIDSFRINLKKSDVKPLELQSDEPVPEPLESTDEVPEQGDVTMDPLWEEKAAKIEQQKKRRKKSKACEQAFTEAVKCLANLMNSQASIEEASADAKALIDNVCGSMVQADDLAVQLINIKGQSDSRYTHIMNVVVLSMMVAQRMDFSEDEMHILGLGALYHDVGVTELPGQVAKKNTRLTEPEFAIYKRHTLLGVSMAQKQGRLPREALRVIAEHHENIDGSGYPRGLTGDQMSRYSKIVSLVNAYDNLTNHLNGGRELTPHEAMSTLFAKDKNRYDPDIMNVFVSILGVYPPGTFVTLSDNRIGIVSSVKSDQLLFPDVMIYDADVPSDQALILDLKEEELSIKNTVKPADITRAVKEYLSMGSAGYYFDS
ncbi:MAG: HD-GYP domain-containing protein [Pseudomonadales bacterium]|nr:HD-GYP domain-containing protein [Pseudomonadales bacterium]